MNIEKIIHLIVTNDINFQQNWYEQVQVCPAPNLCTGSMGPLNMQRLYFTQLLFIIIIFFNRLFNRPPDQLFKEANIKGHYHATHSC